ncbi:MAG: Uma2 family endonuclease [Dehalococcoidia bacterium]|nr:Uma2 family endonuclease [Dehalococcoidia bacterium]
MATPTRTYTPEDLLAMEDGDSYELVDGDLMERRVSIESSWIGLEFGTAFKVYAHANGGIALGSDMGLTIFPWAPDMIRRADALYVRAARSEGLDLRAGYLRIPPDVVAEAVSPNDTAVEVERKVREYLRAGVQLVWVAYPELRTVHIYRQSGGAAVLDDTATLTGEDVLPGFEVPVARLFPPAK